MEMTKPRSAMDSVLLCMSVYAEDVKGQLEHTMFNTALSYIAEGNLRDATFYANQFCDYIDGKISWPLDTIWPRASFDGKAYLQDAEVARRVTNARAALMKAVA